RRASSPGGEWARSEVFCRAFFFCPCLDVIAPRRSVAYRRASGGKGREAIRRPGPVVLGSSRSPRAWWSRKEEVEGVGENVMRRGSLLVSSRASAAGSGREPRAVEPRASFRESREREEEWSW